MSGFTAPAPAASATTITNDGWWPDVEPDTARQLLRIDGTVTTERLRDELITAIGRINHQLSDWRASRQSAGINKLADVPAPVIDNTSQLVHLYQRAVRAAAGARLIERYRNYDITRDGQKEADQQTPSIDELRRDERWCIRDILGQPHATVELI